MGFLHKLWDETLAGPAPESGLGKLRKYDSFNLPSTSTATWRSCRPTSHHDNQIAVTRSISIIRTTSNLSVDPGSPPPDAAAGSSTPATPRTPVSPGTPRVDFKRLTRRKSSAEALESAESRSLFIYDWIIMSALDR